METSNRDYESVKNELECKVYEATKILEELEREGLVFGNGHHMRQAIAAEAVEMLKLRWK